MWHCIQNFYFISDIISQPICAVITQGAVEKWRILTLYAVQAIAEVQLLFVADGQSLGAIDLEIWERR